MFVCPGCEKAARTSPELTAKGCEGNHIEVVSAVSREQDRRCLATVYEDLLESLTDHGTYADLIFRVAAISDVIDRHLRAAGASTAIREALRERQLARG